MRLHLCGRVWIVWVAFVLSLSACKCGKKDKTLPPTGTDEKEYSSTVSTLPGASFDNLAGLIPSESILVLLSADLQPTLAWLDKKAWFQELVKSAPVQDALSGGTLLKLSGLRHRLESSSAVPLGKLQLDKLLGTPSGLALRSGKDGLDALIVKQVDLKVQALDRLVETLNQITPRKGVIESREVFGLRLRDISLSGGAHIYYLLFSNLLLASNSEEYLLEAVTLARGKSKGGILSDSRIAALLAEKGQAGDLVVLLNLQPLAKNENGWQKNVIPGKLLAFRLSSGAKPRLQIAAPAVAENPGKPANARFGAGKIVPLDSRVVIGFADARLKQIWNAAHEQIGNVRKFEKQLGMNVERDLLANLSSQMTVVIEGIDISGKNPLPVVAALFETKDPAAAESAMDKLFSYSFGQPPSKKPLKGKPGLIVHESPPGQDLAPAFAVIENWLIVGSSGDAVRMIAATAIGQRPSIQDLPGFAEKLTAGDKPCFMTTYVDCGLLFDDLVKFSRASGKHSGHFGADDIEETVVPFFEALAKIGRIGGRIVVAESGARGSLVPLQ
jgi:hypothetical protein